MGGAVTKQASDNQSSAAGSEGKHEGSKLDMKQKSASKMQIYDASQLTPVGLNLHASSKSFRVKQKSFSVNPHASMRMRGANGNRNGSGSVSGSEDVSGGARRLSAFTMADVEKNHQNAVGKAALKKYKDMVLEAHVRVLPWTNASKEQSGEAQRYRHKNLVCFGQNGRTASSSHSRDESLERPNPVPKTEDTEELLRAALRGSTLVFGTVSRSKINECVAVMDRVELKRGDRLIRQGSMDPNYFVITEGSCDVLVLKDGDEEETKVASVKPGGGLGEVALLYDRPRTASVVAADEKTVAYRLSRTGFRAICLVSEASKLADRVNFLNSSPMFLWLRPGDVSLLATFFEERPLYAGTPLRLESDELCLVVNGARRGKYFFKARNERDERAITNIFDMFHAKEKCFKWVEGYDKGSSSCLATTATLEAFKEHGPALVDENDCTLLVAKLSSFLEHSLKFFDYEISVLENPRAWLLDRLENMSFGGWRINTNIQEELLQIMEKRKFPANWEISGPDAEKTIIILSGSMKQHGNPMLILPGHIVIGSDSSGEPSQEKFICQSQVNAVLLPKTQGNKKVHEFLTSWIETSKTSPISNEARFKDFVIERVIGEGAFGQVAIVKSRTQPELGFFAMKSIDMQQVREEGHEDHIRDETIIMARYTNHPFLTRLHKLFDEPPHLHLLIDLNAGGELFTYMVQRNRLTEKETVFYSGCIFLGISHLHRYNVAYRDMKPENITLDAKGFPKIIDFGFAKVITSRSYTLCGTPDYLAPEMITHEGHTEMVDIWALGVLIYEMLAGYTPFNEKNTCQNDEIIYRNILEGKIDFGLRYFSGPARSLIRQLCHRDPFQRNRWLTGTSEDIKNHSFFREFPWEQVNANTGSTGKLVPPYVPGNDHNNFRE